MKSNLLLLETKDKPSIKAIYLKDVELRKPRSETGTVNSEDYDKILRDTIFRLFAGNKILKTKDKIRATVNYG